MITNMPISVLVWSRVTSVPARDIIGVPDWARVERYDIAAKGPAGASRDQQRAMWRAMLADRMKLVAHEEQRETRRICPCAQACRWTTRAAN